MRKLVLLVVILVVNVLAVDAQVVYPHAVYKGDTLSFTLREKSYEIVAKKDTFWVLKNSQYQNALVFAKTYKLNEELVIEYKNQIDLLKKSNVERDSLMVTLEKDRDYYRAHWEDCEKDVDTFGKKCKRQKLVSRLAMVGIPVAFALGFIIAK